MNFLLHLTAAQVISFLAHLVLGFSIVQNLLPPTEYFDGCSDKFKARYALLIKLVAFYGSLNFRGAIVNNYLKRNAADPAQQRLDDISKGDSNAKS